MKPLREESAQAARRIAEANAAFAPAPDEQAAAWAHLQRRWDGEPEPGDRRGAGWRLLLGAGALATLAAILWMFLSHRRADEVATRIAPAPVASSPPVPAPPTPAPAGEARPPVQPGEAAPDSPAVPVALRPGRSLLVAGVHARLAPLGAATVRAGGGRAPSVVVLQHGRLDISIDAAGAAPAAGLHVQVESYRIESERGRFRISARGGRVDVAVEGGKLAVWSSRRLLATLVAGERWTNLAPSGRSHALPGVGSGGGESSGAAVAAGDAAAGPPASNAEAAPAHQSPAEKPAVAEVDCARLTRRGAIDPALACFAREAAQPGLVGELALIELARIRRDVKGDLAGAERALAEHRRRFPHGALAAEAAGSRVELLLRLGRATEALVEAERLTGGDAIFWRAVSLSKLGRRVEAVQAFDEYLARPDGKRRAEATRMRADLQR